MKSGPVTGKGCPLKEASNDPRTAMEGMLRPLGMSVTRYACLELWPQRPGPAAAPIGKASHATHTPRQAEARGGHGRGPFPLLQGRIHPLRDGGDGA